MKKIFSIIALSVIMLCAANAANAKKACTKSDNANATEIVIANAMTNSNFNTEIAEPAEPADNPRSWHYYEFEVGCVSVRVGFSGDGSEMTIRVDACGYFIGIYLAPQPITKK